MGCGASTESDGLTELHRLIIDKNWDGVRARIQSNPGQVRQKNKYGVLPLHWAAANEAPLDVVRYLVEKYPDGVREKSIYGNLPLHFAADNKAPLDVVRYLVEKYPDGVREKSNDGQLPLHEAARFSAPLDVVRYLVEQYPQGVHVRGKQNKTPLELAEENGAFSEVASFLRQAEAKNHLPPTNMTTTTTSSVASKPHHSEATATVSHINLPGEWDVFISHCQRDANAVVMAEALFASFEKRGLRVWLDVKMKKRDVAAMEEGAKNSTMVIAIVTGGGDNPDHAFFRREFCLKELRWAQSVGASIQPVITVDDKKRIGEFLSAAPSDLQALGQVDWIDMNRGAVQYWEVGVDMLEERLEEARATRQRQR
ncbi:TIR domain-containing protein [Pycnococcus provasolii]